MKRFVIAALCLAFGLGLAIGCTGSSKEAEKPTQFEKKPGHGPTGTGGSKGGVTAPKLPSGK